MKIYEVSNDIILKMIHILNPNSSVLCDNNCTLLYYIERIFRCLAHQAWLETLLNCSYSLIVSTLYHGGFSTPLLKCLIEDEVEYKLQEMHEGIWKQHFGGKNHSKKSSMIQILLVNHARRRTKIYQKMW